MRHGCALGGLARRPLRATLAALTLCLCSGAAWGLPVCERTPQVRDAIVREAGASSCEEVDAAALSRVQKLGLYGPSAYGRADRLPTAIKSLKAGDFDGLASLRELG